MSQKQSNRELKALLGFMTGTQMGVVVNSAVLPDTRALLERKGYLVKGADVLNTEYMVLVGPLAHFVPKGLPPRFAMTMHEAAGAIMFIEMTSDELHRGLEKQADAPQPPYVKEMKGTVDKLQELADHINRATEAAAEDEDEEHNTKLHIGAILPNGEKLEAIVCRDCAMEFIEGRSEGREYKKTSFLRLLMACAIATADEQKAERVINEKAIKATMEAREKSGKPH